MSLTTMMALGVFRFSIDTLAYQEISRKREWHWVEQDVIGGYPAMQYLGQKAETLTMKGITYPTFGVAGGAQIELMALAAGLGKPMLLVSGLGLVMGFFVIESIHENKSEFIDTGASKKIGFEITLKRYCDILKAVEMIVTDPASIIGL